ncbi:hypothetical protein ACYOEI_31190, partial [Singulisphaera rosea]
LRVRLARRGLAMSATALSIELSTSSASATIPRGLSVVILKAGAGRAAGMLSGPVAGLTEGVLRSMFANSLKSTAIACVASGLLATGVVVHSLKARAEGPNTAAARVSSQRPETEAQEIRPRNTSQGDLAKLNEPVSLDLKQAPLSEALNALANYTGQNIVLDTKAIHAIGLKSSTPVDLTVKNVSLKAALNLLLSPLRLRYQADGDTLVITTESTRKNQHIIKTYYVADLVIP